MEYRGCDGDERFDCRHWLRTGTCAHGDDCDFKHDPAPDRDTVIDQCWSWQQMGICSGRRNGTCVMHHDLVHRGCVQDLRAECRHWLRGGCDLGDDCDFRHDSARCGAEPGDTRCQSWRLRGFCASRRDGSCRFTHDTLDRGCGGDERADCYHWLRIGTCILGDDCDFKHDPESLFIPNAPEGVCFSWMRAGFCSAARQGRRCALEHPRAERSNYGDSRKPCWHKQTTGKCSRTATECDYRHDCAEYKSTGMCPGFRTGSCKLTHHR